jgi:hypothetical protein
MNRPPARPGIPTEMEFDGSDCPPEANFRGLGKIWSKGCRNPYVSANKMKYFFPMLCVVAAGGAGYVFEPQITPNLISYSNTKERVIEVVQKDGKITVSPPAEPTPPPALPKVDPAPTPAPDPAPVVKNDPAPEPTPEPPPVAEKMDETPAPEPEPTPEPPPAGGGALGEEALVALMQESIKGGQVKEFTFDQVLKWNAGSEEEIDGAKYQTGLAEYKAETIFGVKTMKAKALIKDGKVTKWIWATSGMEIK